MEIACTLLYIFVLVHSGHGAGPFHNTAKIMSNFTPRAPFTPRVPLAPPPSRALSYWQARPGSRLREESYFCTLCQDRAAGEDLLAVALQVVSFSDKGFFDKGACDFSPYLRVGPDSCRLGHSRHMHTHTEL